LLIRQLLDKGGDLLPEEELRGPEAALAGHDLEEWETMLAGARDGAHRDRLRETVGLEAVSQLAQRLRVKLMPVVVPGDDLGERDLLDLLGLFAGHCAPPGFIGCESGSSLSPKSDGRPRFLGAARGRLLLPLRSQSSSLSRV